MKKRLFDLFFAIILILLALPFVLAIAIAIKLISCGPIIFCQQRLGRHKIPFTIFKFRTLEDGSENVSHIVTHDDKRITRIGKLLRSTHLDELPQLWNVIKGDMSLIGPRPLTEELVKAHRLTALGYDRRFAIKPGITGLMQIKGKAEAWRRGPARSLQLEVFYMRKQNIMFDLWILFATAKAMWKRNGF